MKCAVAIFAKTIGLSPVKTRLAADIGTERAEAFYALSKRCVEAWVREAQFTKPDTFFPYWVLAEEEGPEHADRAGFPAMWTGEGGLGTRLANVSHSLFREHDAVFLIGTDSPQLQSGFLLDALALLEQDRELVVTGPAADGGFYLFASRQSVRREIWEKVKYSCDSTLDELKWLLDRDDRKVEDLATAGDVDTIDDLRRVEHSLLALGGSLLPEQVQLLKWIGNNLEVGATSR